MPFVTDDKRVKEILGSMRTGNITRANAREAIRALPPQEHATFGYLDWEVTEALGG